MRFKKIEKALLLGMAAAIVFSTYAQSAQRDVAEKLVRLHVIANSDGEEDQKLKLKVRDGVLKKVSELTKNKVSAEGSEKILKRCTGYIEDIAEDIIKGEGYAYNAEATVEKGYFPTKYYENFALPAGEYDSLKVIIGNGEGKNWWCVLFPPLCVSAATDGESALETAEKYGLTEDEAALITMENTGYKIKFKAVELYGKIKHMLTR